MARSVRELVIIVAHSKVIVNGEKWSGLAWKQRLKVNSFFRHQRHRPG